MLYYICFNICLFFSTHIFCHVFLTEFHLQKIAEFLSPLHSLVLVNLKAHFYLPSTVSYSWRTPATHPTSKTANLCPIGTASTFSWWVRIVYLPMILISQIEQPVTFAGDYVHSWLRWHCLRNCPWSGLPSKKMLWQPIYTIVSSNCWGFYGWHIKFLQQGFSTSVQSKSEFYVKMSLWLR